MEDFMLNHDEGDLLSIDSRLKVADFQNIAEKDDYISFYSPNESTMVFVKIKDIPNKLHIGWKNKQSEDFIYPYLQKVFITDSIKTPPHKLKPKIIPQTEAKLTLTLHDGTEEKLKIKFLFETDSHPPSRDSHFVWKMNKHGYMINQGMIVPKGKDFDDEIIHEFEQINIAQSIKQNIGDFAHGLRFKNKTDTSFNVMVGDSAISMLEQYSLDIPKEHFILPYKGGITFLRHSRTNYLTKFENKYHWFSFGQNASRLHFLPPFTLEEISSEGRITPKSISQWLTNIFDKLKSEEGVFEIGNNAVFGKENIQEVSDDYSNELLIGVVPATLEGTFNHYQWNVDREQVLTFKDFKAKNYEWVSNYFITDMLMVCCLNDRELKRKVLKHGVKSKTNATKTKKGLRYWRWGENNVEFVYPKSDKKSSKKLRRHWVRGHIRNQRITRPENHPESYERDGFHYVVKVISPHLRGGNASLDREILNSPLCFGGIGNNHAGGSHIASRWVRKIESKLGRKLQHKENGGEKRIPIGFGNRWYYLDAWDEETNTAYEFHGDYFHGNPKIYAAETVNNKTKKTMGEMYEATLQKKEWLEDNGYNYVCVWESDFNDGLMKSDL